jgi:hypothetical protein
MPMSLLGSLLKEDVKEWFKKKKKRNKNQQFLMIRRKFKKQTRKTSFKIEFNDYKNAFYINPLYRNYLFDGKKIVRYCCLNWFNMVYSTSHT